MLKLTLALLTLLSVVAFADGNLGYSLKINEGFWRVDIVEKDGMREGALSQLGQRYYLTSYWEEDMLHIPFAQNERDYLTAVYYDEKKSYWYGFLYLNFTTRINVYKDVAKDEMRIVGEIGEYLKFDYRTWANKKGKKFAELYWLDQAEEDPAEMSLRIEFTPDKQAGSCKGAMFVANSYEVAKFNCKSDGKLMDAFWKSEQDIIAWLVHLIIYPADPYSGKNLTKAALR